MTTDAKIFREAISLLDKHGWCQGNTQNSLGQMCVRGALIRAARNVGEPARYVESELTLIRLLQLPAWRDGFGMPCVTVWNDADGMTADDVKLGLEFAATVLEQQDKQNFERLMRVVP